MASQYFVMLGDEQVAGPFPTRPEADRRAAELTTNEVGLHYRVKRISTTT